MISIEEGILYSFIIGTLIALIWGTKKIIILERLIISIDQNMQKILKRIEKKESKIEKKISKK